MGDFDGDGLLDTALGYPSVELGAGAVVVVTGQGDVARLGRDSPGILSVAAENDHFGDSVAAGDVDADGYDDLVVGVPGDDASAFDEGSIHIIYGSAKGLSMEGDQILHGGSFGAGADSQGGARFGEAVAVGDFDCDGFADVGVGAPFENTGAPEADEGSVSIFFGSSAGLRTDRDEHYSADAFVGLEPQPDLQLGAALAAGRFSGNGSCTDLVAGAPGARSGRGAAAFVYGGQAPPMSQEVLSQGTGRVDGGISEWDCFGAGLWAYQGEGGSEALVVAVPGELCGSGTGALHVFPGGEGPLVASGELVGPEDEFACVGWIRLVIRDVLADYETCVVGGQSCLDQAFDGLIAAGVLGIAARSSACLVAAETASNACHPDSAWPEGCVPAHDALQDASFRCNFTGDLLIYGR